MNKSWCSHFEYATDSLSGNGDFMETDSGMWVDDDWKFCPFCGKKRPEAGK